MTLSGLTLHREQVLCVLAEWPQEYYRLCESETVLLHVPLRDHLCLLLLCVSEDPLESRNGVFSLFLLMADEGRST